MNADKKPDTGPQSVPYARRVADGSVDIGENMHYDSTAQAVESLGSQRLWSRVRVLVGGGLGLFGSAAVSAAVYERSDNILATAVTAGIVFAYGFYNASNDSRRIEAIDKQIAELSKPANSN